MYVYVNTYVCICYIWRLCSPLGGGLTHRRAQVSPIAPGLCVGAGAWLTRAPLPHQPQGERGRGGVGSPGERTKDSQRILTNGFKESKSQTKSNTVKHINKHLTYIYTLRVKESYITTYTQFIGMYDSYDSCFQKWYARRGETWRRGDVAACRFDNR